MTLPMILALPAGEASAGTATSRAFRAVAAPVDPGATFAMALGAMIAPTQVRTPPSEVPVELVLEGEWRLDLEQAPGESVSGPVGSDLPADVSDVVEDGAIVPLGKSLESWLAMVGRRSAPVPTDVRHGAAEEMVDLVAAEVAGASAASLRQVSAPQLPVEQGSVSQLSPVEPVPLLREAVVLPAAEQAQPEPAPAESKIPPASSGRDVAESQPADEQSGARLLDGDVVAPLETNPNVADRNAQFTGSPYAAGLLAGSNGATSSNASESESSSGYADRLINPEAVQGEPAQADTGRRLDRESAAPVARPQGWGGERMTGMMDGLLDEGLDPEALLARYEARHPAVEIGGFAFPLDALDAVPEGSVHHGAGRGRIESAEA
ncbi:MAG: hypothetical protein ACYC2K_15830, partial [Gemmatimonadales bacterium]